VKTFVYTEINSRIGFSIAECTTSNQVGNYFRSRLRSDLNRRYILRILDDASDKKLDSVSLFLTQEEAIQLRGYLNQLLEDPKLQHSHLTGTDYKKEVTVCLYDEKDLKNFNQRSIRLLKEDR